MDQLTSPLVLGKRIGDGYFGEVYEAVDPIHGQVAVKVLRSDPAESQSDWMVRRLELLHEGQRLRKAEHQHVVRVLQVLEPSDHDKSLHLVLEFCAGGSVGSLYEKGPLTTSRVRGIATQVAMGLEALHNRGMIHRDVKPANILLDEQQNIKIGDFGLVSDNLVLGYASNQGYSDHLAPEVLATGRAFVPTSGPLE